jgi:hypothetical protein
VAAMDDGPQHTTDLEEVDLLGSVPAAKAGAALRLLVERQALSAGANDNSRHVTTFTQQESRLHSTVLAGTQGGKSGGGRRTLRDRAARLGGVIAGFFCCGKPAPSPESVPAPGGMHTPLAVVLAVAAEGTPVIAESAPAAGLMADRIAAEQATSAMAHGTATAAAAQLARAVAKGDLAEGDAAGAGTGEWAIAAERGGTEVQASPPAKAHAGAADLDGDASCSEDNKVGPEVPAAQHTGAAQQKRRQPQRKFLWLLSPTAPKAVMQM